MHKLWWKKPAFAIQGLYVTKIVQKLSKKGQNQTKPHFLQVQYLRLGTTYLLDLYNSSWPLHVAADVRQFCTKLRLVGAL